jgi:DNA invertase Pin-like site-specific DNA recombinase
MNAQDMRPYVSWIRVSTKKQGDSGLGLAAQQAINRHFMGDTEPIVEFTEVYTGTNLERCTELRKAIDAAKSSGAMLVIAKADRFRTVIEALRILEEMGEGNIKFCDAPGSNKLILTILFAVYQNQAEIGKINTRLALNEVKKIIARDGFKISKAGKKCTHLGAPKGQRLTENALDASARVRKQKVSDDSGRRQVYELMQNLRTRGDTMQVITDTLNSLGYKAPRGGAWQTGQVSRALSDWGKFFNQNSQMAE